jgi:cephalosporin hydroxylase
VTLSPYLLALTAPVAAYLLLDLFRKQTRALPRNVLKDKAAALAVVLLLQGVVLAQYLSFPGDRQVIDRFHQLYYDDGDTWRTSNWLGIPTQQNPNDVWVHQEIISELKPDFVVEAGTLRGGSAAIWAMVLAQVNPDGRVITIDVRDNADGARAIPAVKERVEFLTGSSTDPAIVDQVRERVSGKNVLVILDSDHSRDHVLAELRAYSPLVPVGGYVIVQDTNVNGHPVLPEFGPGPMEAVEAFLAENDSFAPDPRREKLLFTMHPRGYLKRVK